jgi:hypothetical protein
VSPAALDVSTALCGCCLGTNAATQRQTGAPTDSKCPACSQTKRTGPDTLAHAALEPFLHQRFALTIYSFVSLKQPSLVQISQVVFLGREIAIPAFIRHSSRTGVVILGVLLRMDAIYGAGIDAWGSGSSPVGIHYGSARSASPCRNGLFWICRECAETCT